jgi:hypothetical protein
MVNPGARAIRAQRRIGIPRPRDRYWSFTLVQFFTCHLSLLQRSPNPCGLLI